jgi:hypothetical protein
VIGEGLGGGRGWGSGVGGVGRVRWGGWRFSHQVDGAKVGLRQAGRGQTGDRRTPQAKGRIDFGRPKSSYEYLDLSH